MTEGRLELEERNLLLAEMTDEVAALVLEDNRLQTLALSIAERGGARALPQLVRVIEILEESGRLNRAVEGLDSNEELLRRAQAESGPDPARARGPAVDLQDAAAGGDRGGEIHRRSDARARTARRLPAGDAASGTATAILAHRLKKEIIATKVANRFVNRLGIVAPFALTEEEGAAFGQAAAAFLAAERLFDMDALWAEHRRRPTCPRRSGSLCSSRPRPASSSTSPTCCAAPRRT